MTTSHFQILLSKAAVAAMAIDGEIHDNEVKELRAVASQTPYFFDFDYNQALDENTSFVKAQGKNAINQWLDEIAQAELSDKQKWILVEVLLRVMDADHKADPSELIFLQLVITKIHLNEEQLITRFPTYIHWLAGFTTNATTYFDRDIHFK